MCGIVCIISKGHLGLRLLDTKMFSELLFADQVRGWDGTGIFYDTKNDGVVIDKDPTDAYTFQQTTDYKKSLEQCYQEATFIVGHNRWATKGIHNWTNTHPFQEKHITLVHNGTLDYHRQYKDVDNDSLAICHGLAERGADEMLKSMQGAFALIWHDSFNSTLNIIRNDERPLAYLETKELYVFCSELKMGQWILERNKMQVIDSYEIESGRLNTFDLFTRKWTSVKKEIRPKSVYIPAQVAPKKHTPLLNSMTSVMDTEFTEGTYQVTSTTNVTNLKDHKKSKQQLKKEAREQRRAKQYGEEIIWLPSIIRPYGNSNYLEGIYEDETGKEIEVRAFSPNKKDLEHLLTFDYVKGILAQRVVDTKKERQYVIARTNIGGVVTKNGQFLNSFDIAALPAKCHCCDGNFATGDIQMLEHCHIEKEPRKELGRVWRAYCVDCTDFLDHEGSHYECIK